MDNLIGRDLGRYHILEQLGEGGMATVYKAYDTRLERDVAVKIIRTDQFAPAVLERILKRFEREAKALARLTHPNIVGVIDYGEHEEAPYLVMPYLPGGTLKQRLGKPMPWQEAVQILLPIAQALEYAHEHNIIHRDIKPSNILLTEKGQPMLADFGIAKILESEETQTLTGTGVGVGTPEYMAPEQWTGQVTPQSDIYSLGVVLYELVTGRKPYVADTPAAVLLKQATEPLPRPAQYVPGLPDAAEKVLLKALAKRPEDRYQNMGEFTDGLEHLVAGQPKGKQPVIGVIVTPSTSKPLPDTQATVLQEETNTARLREISQDIPPTHPMLPRAIRKPGKVQAIAIMTLISGVLNCFWGLSAAVSLFAANFFALYWAPYAITLGILEIVYAAKLLGQNPKVQPANYLAIMQIINITTLNVYQLFVGDVVVGILALVFYSDPEVRAYFARIRGVPPDQVPTRPVIADKSGFAIAALIMGITAFVLNCFGSIFLIPIGIIPAVPGIILGIIGIKSAKRGLSIAGIVVAALTFVISLIWIVALIYMYYATI